MTGQANGYVNAGVGTGVRAQSAAQARQGAQATPQRSRWGRIWPWALLWGAAPMPLYIWIAVGMLV